MMNRRRHSTCVDQSNEGSCTDLQRKSVKTPQQPLQPKMDEARFWITRMDGWIVETKIVLEGGDKRDFLSFSLSLRDA